MSSGIPTTCKHGEDAGICEPCWDVLGPQLKAEQAADEIAHSIFTKAFAWDYVYNEVVKSGNERLKKSLDRELKRADAHIAIQTVASEMDPF